MAGRKDKNTIDYFPHYCNHGKTLFIIENKHGNNGYAVWFKTLEMLGANENHYIDCRNTADYQFLQAKMKLMQTEIEEVYNTLAELNAIHKELWENKIIWSNNFVKNVEDVYKRRNSLCMNFSDLCKHLLIKCKHKYDNKGNYVIKNAQSKVKESKVNKIIYNNFYDSEILKSEQNENYINFVKTLFGENTTGLELENVLKMKKQVSYEQFGIIMDYRDKHKVSIGKYLVAMENWKDLLKKNTNVQSTLINWINRDVKKTK